MKSVVGIITHSESAIGGGTLELELFGAHTPMGRRVAMSRGEAMQYSLGRLFNSFTKAEAVGRTVGLREKAEELREIVNNPSARGTEQRIARKVADALDLIDVALQSWSSL